MLGKMMRRCRGWFAADGGVAAIEFALVGPPFLLMLIGIIEVSIFFASGVILEGGASDAARLIRTGQVQISSNPVKMFEDGLCAKVSRIISCNNLQYEVLTVPNNSFSNAGPMQPHFDENGDLISGGFTPGNADDIILVRVMYHYEFLTPLLGAIMAADTTEGTSILMSTLVIKNEPYTYR